MKNIPIWQQSSNTISISQQQSFSSVNSTTNVPVAQYLSYSFSQITPIYIDQCYQILSASRGAKNSHAINGRKRSEQLNQQDIFFDDNFINLNNEQHTLIYDIQAQRSIILAVDFKAVLLHNNHYIIVLENSCKRYEIIQVHKHNFWDLVIKIQKHGMTSYLEHAPNLNNGDLKPLSKINSYFNMHNQSVYVLGSKPIFYWELTSQVWSYSLSTCKWTQQMNALSFSQQLLAKNIKKKNQWMVMLQDIVFCIGDNYVKVIKKNQVNNQNNNNIIRLNRKNDQTLFKPNEDTFLFCSINVPVPRLFILTKPSCVSREPILFSITMNSHCNSLNRHHTTSVTKEDKQQNKNKNLNQFRLQSDGVYISIVRYDTGIFLQNHRNLNKNQHMDKKSQNNIHELMQRIMYMNIKEGNHSLEVRHNSSVSIFTKKNDQSSKIKCNKSQTLRLYTKNTKKNTQSSTHSIHVIAYSINLNNLQIIAFQQKSKMLSLYFQRKQYCDLTFIAQKRQISCNRQLFEYYSSKFKRLYSNSSSQPKKQSSLQGQTLVKLDHTKYSTIYFLVQHLYQNFSTSLKGIQSQILIDLMVLAQKFQITELQHLCEQEVEFSCDNFVKLYDYFRNSETLRFRQQFLKFFIIHAQQIIKIMPIGKVQQLIRLVYSPECIHSNVNEVKAQLQNRYTIKDSQTGQIKQFNKYINYSNIIKSSQINIKICLKCHRILGFNHESHRKNKSSVRGNSLSVRHKKKDNNSN